MLWKSIGTSALKFSILSQYWLKLKTVRGTSSNISPGDFTTGSRPVSIVSAGEVNHSLP